MRELNCETCKNFATPDLKSIIGIGGHHPNCPELNIPIPTYKATTREGCFFTQDLSLFGNPKIILWERINDMTIADFYKNFYENVWNTMETFPKNTMFLSKLENGDVVATHYIDEINAFFALYNAYYGEVCPTAWQPMNEKFVLDLISKNPLFNNGFKYEH